ncbi:DUF2306 domain-containing protein [Nonomuraea sp. 10N515B]|uniref:DUF2306 domain-containing protein n=1 Tax=Nonomuraea sp. 10N515B TaxID=3457422 RepID=UPI003FCE4A20
MTLQTTRTRRPATRAGWLLPAGLIVLSFVPVLAGAVRLTELAGGADVTPANARFVAMPLPVMLHIVAASLYSVLGAFQFGRVRRRWHRPAGRNLIPAGLVTALSGLWMTLFLARPPGDGDLLAAFRLVFGTTMAVSLVLGLAAILRRDIAGHRAWMTRAYAIGMGAGTQAVTQAVWLIVHGGEQDEVTRALLLAAGWVINLAVAEGIIRRRRRSRVSA